MYIASSEYEDHQVVAQNLRDNIEDLLYVCTLALATE